MTELTFCQHYVRLAGDLASLGRPFVIAALILGIAFGIAETMARFRAPAAPAQTARGLADSPLKDLIDALKGFLEALAKAPAWIAMMGVGVLLFWAAAATVPATCLPEMNKPSPGPDAPSAPPAHAR